MEELLRRIPIGQSPSRSGIISRSGITGETMQRSSGRE
jgi:hypothetical protein